MTNDLRVSNVVAAANLRPKAGLLETSQDTLDLYLVTPKDDVARIHFQRAFPSSHKPFLSASKGLIKLESSKLIS